MTKAEDFIKAKDAVHGENWTNDAETLCDAFEEYAQLRMLENARENNGETIITDLDPW